MLKPIAWKYTDSYGTHFTEEFSEIENTVGIESWTALYSGPWCSTCGVDIQCPKCNKWWKENEPE